MIPIYGFAAVSILITTASISHQKLAVFVVGSLTATIFELVTGSIMEKLFQVKYWDYSDFPLNYKGHICLFVSMFWRLLSVVLVQMIHVLIADVIARMPRTACETGAIVLIILFTYDTVISLNEAMELRNLLELLAENSEIIKHIESRISAMIAFAPLQNMDERRGLKGNLNEKIEDRAKYLRERNEEYINKIKEHIQLPEFDGFPECKEWIRKLSNC